MTCFGSMVRCGLACLTARLLCGLCPAVATAQSVNGTGVSFYDAGAVDGANYFEQITVHAWLDADGVAHGTLIWEDAEQSAGQSLFGSPGKVFEALKAVAEVGRAYFKAHNGGPPLGPVDRAFHSRVPFKYTGFESQTTRNLFGAERVFHQQGQTRRMQRHLTLGGGTTNNCLQIYFDFDDPTRRVLIGYCGRHLPYARQRT